MLRQCVLWSVAAVAGATFVLAPAVMATTSGGTARPSGRLTGRVALPGRRSPTPTTASNKRAAERDALQMLAGVQPPAGSVVQSGGAGTGTTAHLITTAFASATAYRSWTVPDGTASVLAYVRAHLPRGATVLSTGSGGPNPVSHTITYARAPVDGVLDVRWLEIVVTSRSDRATLLYAEAQSQWIVTRPAAEQIPPHVEAVEVTEAMPGKAPLVSRRITNRRRINALVGVFDSLWIVQPGAINCPLQAGGQMIVTATFIGPTGRVLARGAVSSAANVPWSPNLAGWECLPLNFTVRGQHQPALAGNVIAPIQRLLSVHLGLAKRTSRS